MAGVSARQDKSEQALSFVNLRVHSAFSLLEGALPIDRIVEFAVSDGAPAVAVADTGNLFGALDFAQKAVKAGIQPIIGCQLDVDFADGADAPGQGHNVQAPARPLVLIAASEDGYANLIRLVSRAYLENSGGGAARLGISWFEGAVDGVIALTGGARGAIGSLLLEHPELAETRLLRLKLLFGDRLYAELQRQQGFDPRIEALTIDLAYRHGVPLVAANEAFFGSAADYEAHDALLAIADGALMADDNRRRLGPDYCLQSQAHMTALFADLPEALANSVEIARRCHFLSGQTRSDPAEICHRQRRNAGRP